MESSGAQADGSSGYRTRISADGRFVAFHSQATKLVPGDGNNAEDAFLRGPFLTLESSSDHVTARDTLTLSVWRGLPSGLLMIVAHEPDGLPILTRVLLDQFDGTGAFVASAVVPPLRSGTRA